MENKIVKVYIGGKEYSVTDKQAQLMVALISDKVEVLEKGFDELKSSLQWIRVD